MKEKTFKIVEIFIFSAIILINLICLLLMFFHNCIVSITAIITQNVDMQILFFAIFSALIGISFIILLFYKIKLSNKIMLMFLFLILQFCFVHFSSKLPSVNKMIQIDICADTSKCTN